MEDETINKKPFFILLIFSIIVVISILVFENNSSVLNQSKYKNLDKIVIDAEYSNVEVKYLETNEAHLLVYGKNSDDLSVKEYNNVLTIKKNSTKGICIFNCSDKIVLYLPKEFERLDIALKMGNVEVEKTKINDIYITDEVGNVSLDTINSANIDVGIGDVNIKKIDGEFDSYIKIDKGNVTINKVINMNIKANSNTGKVNVKETKDNDFLLTVETNVGNIKIK